MGILEQLFGRRRVAQEPVRSPKTVAPAEAVEPVDDLGGWLPVLQDPSGERRDEAAKAIQAMDPARTVPAVVKVMASCNDEVFKSGLYLLKAIGGDRAIEALMALSTSLRGDSRGEKLSYVVFALGDIGDRRTLDLLFGFLSGEALPKGIAPAYAEEIQWWAGKGIARIAGTNALERVLSLRSHRGRPKGAVVALREIGGPIAREALVRIAATDDDGDVRREARRSLEKMDATALKELDEMLQPPSITPGAPGAPLAAALARGVKFSRENPIRMLGTDAVVYFDDRAYSVGPPGWYLKIPVDAVALKEREVIVDPAGDPDRFVADALREAPSWGVPASEENRIYDLMTGDRQFDSNNPVIIERVASLYRDRQGAWKLRVAVSAEAEVDIDVGGKLGPLDREIGRRIVQAITSLGIRLALGRG